MTNYLHHIIDFILGVDTRKVLNEELSLNVPLANIATEMRTIVDELKIEAFNNRDGLVDYAGLNSSPIYLRYKKIAGSLKLLDLSSLQSRGERLAFWINLYNSLIIDAVISLGIKRTVWEKGFGFFRKIAYEIGGLRYSADDIEHGILRNNQPHPLFRVPQFTTDDIRLRHSLSLDPRVHFTLVCASRSCPIITIYHATEIDNELDIASSSFINGGGVIINPEKHKLSLSRIFKWYQADFGGRRGIIEFILKYIKDGPDKDFIINKIHNLHIEYQKYDWSLNH